MNPAAQKKISKRLSFVLRHRPDTVGLVLDAQGWVEVEVLLAALADSGRKVSSEELETVVAENPKRRFEFDDTRTRIRARQGHSVEIDLGYTPVVPPEVLFHGTAECFLPSIREQGLRKMSRHHVHLSEDRSMMMEVGRRHGVPVLLEVAAGAMQAAGHLFYRTDNAVWLVEKVPPEFLKVP